MRRVLLVLTLIGCGGGGKSGSTTEEIIGRDWTVPAGTEMYKCISIPVDHDMYISDFQTENPLGEHHTVLTVTDQLALAARAAGIALERILKSKRT